jgi:phosphatidylglycerophosphatase A
MMRLRLEVMDSRKSVIRDEVIGLWFSGFVVGVVFGFIGMFFLGVLYGF